jgi:hypothetical protein
MGRSRRSFEVDPDAGAVTIERIRIVIVEDCGSMLNPVIVDGQIRGDVAQGIGIALLERYLYDDAGQPQTTTLAECLIPRATDLPPIEIEHLETPSEDGTAGIKGMAEGPASATPSRRHLRGTRRGRATRRGDRGVAGPPRDDRKGTYGSGWIDFLTLALMRSGETRTDVMTHCGSGCRR